MRCWPALPLLLLGVSLPACAQHGAQRGGGAHGGFSGGGHAAGGFHGATSGSPRGYARPVFAPRSASSPQRFGSSQFRGSYPSYSHAPSAARPAFYSRNRIAYPPGYGDNQHGNRGRDGRLGYRYGYGYPFGLSYLDYGFPFWDDFDSSSDDAGDTGYGYGAQPPQDDPANAYAAQQPYAGDPAGAMQYPPFMPQGPSAAAPAQAGPAEEDAITVVFKDGRPSEQVHNYALTRTALYITDKHMREIPLDQIDLPATQRVNHDAGVDFQLP